MKTLKQIIIFSAITLLFSSCTNINNKNQTDLEELGIKGKVKSIIVKSFEAEEKFGNAIKTTMKDFYQQIFNENGFITEMHIFNAEGVKVATSFYKYDEKGHIYERIYVFEIESNNGGKIKRSTKSIYNSNEQGLIIEENLYSSENLFDSKVTYIYDENNLKIGQNTYNVNGDLIGKEAYKYNKERQVIEAEKYSIENNIEQISTTEYWYNDKGYRSRMRFVSIDEYAHIDFMSSFEYEYDYKGNWVTEIIYSEEASERKPFRITEREIKYY